MSVELRLLRDGAMDDLPAEPGDAQVRLWRFTENRFVVVFSCAWHELPLKDNRIPYGETEAEWRARTDAETRADWFARHKTVDIDSWDHYSDVWTAPPWISSVSMKIGLKDSEGELAYGIKRCERVGNAEDGGTFFFPLHLQGLGSQ